MFSIQQKKNSKASKIEALAFIKQNNSRIMIKKKTQHIILFFSNIKSLNWILGSLTKLRMT